MPFRDVDFVGPATEMLMVLLGQPLKQGVIRQALWTLVVPSPGELGGPPAPLGPLLGEFLGIEQSPIVIERDGNRHRIQVGISWNTKASV